MKRLLAQEPERSPANFVDWLQKSVRSGLAQIGNHPADQVRKRMLEEFAATPVERFLAADNRQSIPQTIGVRCAVVGSPFQYDVARADRGDGRVFQHYMTDPHWRAVYVGYRAHNGTVDRSHPVLLFVNQIWAVTQREGTKETPLKVAPDSPLRGRALGSSGSLKEFRVSWEAALEE